MLLLIFGGTLLIIIVLTALAYMQDRQVVASSDASQASYQRMLVLQTLLNEVIQAEASQRAYFVTGDPVYAEEFDTIAEKIAADVATLKEAEFPATTLFGSSLPHRIGELAAQRLNQLGVLISQGYQAALPAAEAAISRREGKQIMDNLHEHAAQLMQAERQYLQQRNAAAESSSAERVGFLTGAILLNLLLLGIASRTVGRSQAHNEALLDQIRNSNDEINRISEFSSNLQSCTTRAEANRIFIHYMRLLFPECSGALYLMRSSRNQLELAASWHAQAAPFDDHMLPQDCWALRRGIPYKVLDPTKELRCEHINEDDRASLCLPLVAQSELIGVMHFRAEESSQMEAVEHLADQLAPQTSTALAAIFLREALREQSIRDPLTKLFNRRYMEETIVREIMRAGRAGSCLSVVMVDLDHFKNFNDEHGHQAGDTLLKSFAQYLMAGVRGEDIVCRYGGEEFLIILVGATLKEAMVRAESLRANLPLLNVSFHGMILPQVTGSWGVATFPDDGDDWESVIYVADAAMYKAKQHGRDRVCSAHDLLKNLNEG